MKTIPGRHRAFNRRAIPPDTVVTEDNYQIILGKDGLIEIANSVSSRTGRKMTTGEMNELVNFILKIPVGRYIGRTYPQAAQLLAEEFLGRHEIAQQSPGGPTVAELAHLDDGDTLHEYQRAELGQYTPSENQLKHSMFADRRGNAIIDRDRVEGRRGTPNNTESSYIIPNKVNETMDMVQRFLAPEGLRDLMRQYHSTYQTYQTVSLAHQNVQLDSRNRLFNHSWENEYKWNLHPAADVGQRGDVILQDTLQQVIQIRLCPFWVPYNTRLNLYYRKFRLLIKEMTSDATTVPEFPYADPNEAKIDYYHFELEVRDVSAGRVYLAPVCAVKRFRKPIAQVNTLTLRLYSPYNELVLGNDFGVFTITYGNPTVFSLTSGTDHGLNTGDLVYITNVNSAVASLDNIFNRLEGHFIVRISATQFEIPVDSSIIIGADTNINVYYGSKRIFINFEFLSLEQ